MLKPAARLTVKPNTFLYIGYSSAPKGAIVLSATEDRVRFRCYPYTPGSDRVEQRAVFEALAHKGTAQHVANLRQSLALYPRAGELRDRIERQIAEYAAALDGGELPAIDPVDFERVRWVARYVGPVDHLRARDAWYAAEQFGGVGGREVDGETLYEIDGAMSEFKRCAASPDWQVLGFANRGPVED